MNKLVLATIMACVLVSGAAQANDSYSKNPILRPITLNDGEFEVTGVIGTKSQVDGSDKNYLAPGLRYGITDNLMVGDGGLSYRFWSEDGLQLGVNAGFRGDFESDQFGDSLGLGAVLFGKQVINENFAFTFGLGYVHWDEEKLQDKSEFKYSLGAMFNIAPDWTLSGGYTYRDLKDFNQDSANLFRLSLGYAVNDDIDVGIYAVDSDFEEVINGHYLHEKLDKTAGVFMNWRF